MDNSIAMSKSDQNDLNKKEIIQQAAVDFSTAADALSKLNVETDITWQAFASFCNKLSNAKTPKDIQKLKDALTNEESLSEYILFLKAEDENNFRSEMRKETSIIKEQNERLDDQNKELLEQNGMLIDLANQSEKDAQEAKTELKETRLELKETRAELKEAGKKDVRNNIISVVAGALFSAALTFIPMALKKEDVPAKPTAIAQPKGILLYRPKLEIHNHHYFTNPIASGDGKKNGTHPTNDKDNVPILKPRAKKVRPAGFTPE